MKYFKGVFRKRSAPAFHQRNGDEAASDDVSFKIAPFVVHAAIAFIVDVSYTVIVLPCPV